MDTSDEVAANQAIHDALTALQRARDLSVRAGYGSLVVGPLVDAQRETQYALDTASERTSAEATDGEFSKSSGRSASHEPIASGTR